jgi:hypothetical protein
MKKGRGIFSPAFLRLRIMNLVRISSFCRQVKVFFGNFLAAV